MPKAIFTSLFAIAIISQIGAEQSSVLKINESPSRDFIEKVFREVIEDIEADNEIISQYFSPLYIQYVDGHTLNYDDFVQHMKIQKTLLTSAQVSIEHCVSEGNTICTVHRVDAIKKNGEKVAVKVISYYELEGGKIVLCDELTYLLKGEEEDQQIGSVK